MSKFRLIDANALCEYSNNQKDKSISANDIMRFPMVDAIPVEWLKKYQLENEKQGSYDMVGAIEVMLWDWEEEQGGTA